MLGPGTGGLSDTDRRRGLSGPPHDDEGQFRTAPIIPSG
jgi:hypothetical protein